MIPRVVSLKAGWKAPLDTAAAKLLQLSAGRSCRIQRLPALAYLLAISGQVPSYRDCRVAELSVSRMLCARVLDQQFDRVTENTSPMIHDAYARIR